MWWTAKNKKPREGSVLANRNRLIQNTISNKPSRNFYCKSKNAGSKVPSNNGYYAKTNSPSNAWIEKHCEKPDFEEPSNILAPVSNMSNTSSVTSDPRTPRSPVIRATRKTLEANVKRAQKAVNASANNEYHKKYSPENRQRHTRTLKAAKNALRDFKIHGF